MQCFEKPLAPLRYISKYKPFLASLQLMIRAVIDLLVVADQSHQKPRSLRR